MGQVYEEKRKLSIPTCTIGADSIHATLMTSSSEIFVSDVVHCHFNGTDLLYLKFSIVQTTISCFFKRHIAVCALLTQERLDSQIDSGRMLSERKTKRLSICKMKRQDNDA